MKMMTPTKEQAAAHYADLAKKPFFPGLINFFSSGPIVCSECSGLVKLLRGQVTSRLHPRNCEEVHGLTPCTLWLFLHAFAVVWEGHNAALGGRKLMGETNPAASAPGSIRGDLCVLMGRNIIHGSDSPQSAQEEIAHWFKPEELNSWTLSCDKWLYEGRD